MYCADIKERRRVFELYLSEKQKFQGINIKKYKYLNSLFKTELLSDLG